MKRILVQLLTIVFLIIITSNVFMIRAQTVLLYQNNFDSPLITPSTTCSPDTDITPVNTLWGGTGMGTGGGGNFLQEFTVETILINGMNNQYTDPLGLGGDYCLGMLSDADDDMLALTLNSQMLPYLNMSFLMSPIDVPACGGPFGVDTAKMHVKVYDSPGGTFSFASPGILLNEATIKSGEPGATPYTFNWSNDSTSLEISNSIDGNITIVFDLIQSGFAAIDNIKITSSITSTPIQETNISNNLILFPNPFTNELRIHETKAKGKMIIIDAMGRIVYTQETFSSETRINTENLSSGIYFLNYFVKDELKQFKLVKK